MYKARCVPLFTARQCVKCGTRKIRAQHKAGEILSSMEKNKGAQGTGSNQYQEVRLQPETTPQTYAELGIDKRDAHTWRQCVKKLETAWSNVRIAELFGVAEGTIRNDLSETTSQNYEVDLPAATIGKDGKKRISGKQDCEYKA